MCAQEYFDHSKGQERLKYPPAAGTERYASRTAFVERCRRVVRRFVCRARPATEE